MMGAPEDARSIKFALHSQTSRRGAEVEQFFAVMFRLFNCRGLVVHTQRLDNKVIEILSDTHVTVKFERYRRPPIPNRPHPPTSTRVRNPEYSIVPK